MITYTTQYAVRIKQSLSKKYHEVDYPAYGQKRSDYIQRVSAGLQAKKYKGGQAAHIKAQTAKLFEGYFKPLS